jgi:Resolvase, N terminal domain
LVRLLAFRAGGVDRRRAERSHVGRPSLPKHVIFPAERLVEILKRFQNFDGRRRLSEAMVETYRVTRFCIIQDQDVPDDGMIWAFGKNAAVIESQRWHIAFRIDGGEVLTALGLMASELCKRKKTTLLIAKLDRLARNVAFIPTLMESGVAFIATDNPHANKLMIHMLAAFAEHERDQIRVRTKAALAAARARGVALGQYGREVLSSQNHKEAVERARELAP